MKQPLNTLGFCAAFVGASLFGAVAGYFLAFAIGEVVRALLSLLAQ